MLKRNNFANFKLIKQIIIIICIIIFTIIMSLSLWCSGKMGEFGSLLSGIGTLGLLLAAIWQIPHEIAKYRNQVHNERVTDIVFEVGEVVTKFSQVLKQLINPMSFSSEVLEEDKNLFQYNPSYTYLVKIFRYRVKQNENIIKEFYDKNWKIRYMTKGDELEECMEKLKNIYWNLATRVHMLSKENLSNEQLEVFHNEFYSYTSKEEIDLLEKKIMKELSKNFN